MNYTVTSLKPRQGRSWKRLRRIQIVCELESKFISDAEIARHLGLTVQALYHIKMCPEYQILKISKQTGVMSELEKSFQMTDADVRAELAEMVPLALRSARDILGNPDHPQHAKIIQDIFDRNRSTSKISRTEVSVADRYDMSKENLKAKELLDMLENSSEPVTIEAIKPYDSHVGTDENSSKNEIEEDIDPPIDILDKLNTTGSIQ